MKTQVVILNWNGRSHLEKFLPGVIATTGEDAEVVVADNGSDDDSVEYLERNFPGLRIVRLDKNYGYAGGYDLALAQLTADYFILLNSDVETTAGWVAPLVKALDADPKLGAVSPKILSYADRDSFEYAGASGGFIDIFGYPFCRGRILGTVEKDNGQYDTSRDVFWASGACFACRRELFTEVGGFDTDFFAHMEEIDLCWRSQLYGYRIAVEPRSVVYHLGGGTLPTGSPYKIYLNYRNSLAMLYKNLPKDSLLPILFCRMALDGISALVFLLTPGNRGFFGQVWRAHCDFRKWRRNTLITKRKEIQSRKVSGKKTYGIYRGSIILRYIFVSKKFGDIL